MTERCQNHKEELAGACGGELLAVDWDDGVVTYRCHTCRDVTHQGKHTEERILELLNKARAGVDLPALTEIPKGAVDSAGSCPIANALFGDGREPDHFSVSAHSIYLSDQDYAFAISDAWAKGEWSTELWDGEECYVVRTPSILHNWISRFDLGEFPEYRSDLDVED